MKWLISYRMTACFMHHDVGVRSNAPLEWTSVIDRHPAQFLLDAIKQERAVCDGPMPARDRPPQRFDRIEVIYSAIPIEDDALADKLLEAM